VEDRGLSAYLAELVGTFLLVLFIALIVSVYTLGAAAGPSAAKLAGFSLRLFAAACAPAPKPPSRRRAAQAAS
jgi:glycerol uptake facilitator-like aquaporin